MTEDPKNKKICVVERRGSQRYQGFYALLRWLRKHDYDVVVLTTDSIPDAETQAKGFRRLMPLYGLCMDASQWNAFEEAERLFKIVAGQLMPRHSIVHFVGTTGQSEEEVSNAFLAKYLTKG